MKLLKIGKWKSRFCHLIKAFAAEAAVENTTSKEQMCSWKFDTAFIGTVEFCQQCVSGFWSYSRGLIFTHWRETVLQQEISYSVSTAVITQKIVVKIRKDRRVINRNMRRWSLDPSWIHDMCITSSSHQNECVVVVVCDLWEDCCFSID